MRNNGIRGKVLPLVQEQWDMFDNVNLKGEPI